MELFRGTNLLDFADYFSAEDKCYEYLASIKWTNGYVCKKCGHIHYVERDKHSRMCSKCKTTESTTSRTLLHKLKFNIRKAFMIMFEMTVSSKGLSSLQISKRYDINYKTALRFTNKIREAMQSSNKYPLSGLVEVDEFTIGSKEKGKVGRSKDTKKVKAIIGLELTESGDKIKRVYFEQIEDYSSKSLTQFFDKKISKEAKVKTDKWRGYLPLKEAYKALEQEKSKNGENFPKIHIVIHQVKTWIRTIFSGVKKDNIQKYFDEFSFRLNRSIFKDTIFHKLVERMVAIDIKLNEVCVNT